MPWRSEQQCWWGSTASCISGNGKKGDARSRATGHQPVFFTARHFKLHRVTAYFAVTESTETPINVSPLVLVISDPALKETRDLSPCLRKSVRHYRIPYGLNRPVAF